jgi:alpha-methylacyl-CoA racemase
MTEINPRLVYCSLTGYGHRGPYRDRAGHDLNYEGLAGLLDLSGPLDGPPVVPGIPLADLTGALWAAVGIMQALLDRERTGRGQRVDGSFLGAALACLPHAVAQHAGGQRLARGSGDLTGGLVCYNLYETLDNGYMTLAALEPQFWAAFCGAVGREDLLGQQLAPAISGEPAFEELCALFRSRTQAEWTEVLAGVDACCEPVYSVGEALASAPVRALGMLAGEGLLPPVRLSAWPERSRGTVPALGADSADLLAELGYDATEVKRLQGQGII